jgi:hypothetical protein
LDNGAVDGVAQSGTVEIHEMQKSGSFFQPLPCCLDGIGSKDRFLGKIALPQANATTASQINGRKDEHLPPFSLSGSTLCVATVKRPWGIGKGRLA